MGKTKMLVIRLSDAEQRLFQKQAAREPLATWARRILLEYCERRGKSQRKGG